MSKQPGPPHIVGVECLDRTTREGLSDADFWQRVADSMAPGDCGPSEPDFDDLDHTTNQDTACSECGEHGACATDSEGRAMVHIQTNGDDE